ncbi:hypothetical protein [Spiractinospora alimapuensis]|uniref:hypothetical protein n=1 Tax=Spiractinospora alimapuensis TaxID=2820884 RepID=UPI001F2B9783|nr:hypothetical protein [Spiractinospora alimapuensis]
MARARHQADAAVAALPEGYAGTGAFSIHLTADGPPYVATSLLLSGDADGAAAATGRVLCTAAPGPSRARALLILALAEAGRGRADEAAAAGTAALTGVPPAWATMALARRLDQVLADSFAGAGEVSSYRALYRDEVQRASTPSLPPGGPDGR